MNHVGLAEQAKGNALGLANVKRLEFVNRFEKIESI